MKNILPLLLAAALGSAATYFIMDNARPAAAAPAAKGAPRVAGAPGAPDAQGGQAPGADGQARTKGNFGGRTKNGGFLPEEIPGVSAEQMTKCRAAIMKTFRDEGVTAARNKVRDLRKELDGAKEEDKKTLEAEIADAEKDVHKAQKAALVAADPDITDDSADKVLAALEERMAQFRASKGGNGKGK
jgi:hypothetical protein